MTTQGSSGPAPGLHRLGVVLIVALLILIGVVGVRAAATASPGDPDTLRLTGSNTLGSELAPGLARGFLASRGASEIQETRADGVDVVSGVTAERRTLRVETRAAGSETGFTALADDEADVAMSSRRISAGQRDELGERGDLTAPEAEHVVALDGIAVIVPASSPVITLSVAQVRAVFGCQITDWASLGGRPGAITVYARDDASGTFELFRDRVLAGGSLCPSAVRFADSTELSRAVATDPRAIGFVALPFAGATRALALSDGDAPAEEATTRTISLESYPLTRRLYLYTPTLPEPSPLAREFVEYAVARTGQQAVVSAGFVSPYFPELNPQEPEPEQPAPQTCTEPLPAYCEQVRGAVRTQFDVRFDSGSDRVDNRAFRNLDLLGRSVAETGRKLLLVGFADAAGTDQQNQQLSEQRARSVQAFLSARGIAGARVVGFGEQLPVATNDTEPGREQNRRVEVWVR